MEDDKLHLMITSERCSTRSLAISKKKLLASLGTSLVLIVGSVVGWSFTYENVSLKYQVASLENNLGKVVAQKNSIEAKAAKQEQDQQALLKTALAELKQRSEVIESILDTVGVEIAEEENPQNAGGPFTSLPEDSYEHLTLLVDQYLDTIRSVPLGPPVSGSISSKFGRRIDPINKRPAFHSGVDIKNHIGAKIVAPADGKIIGRGYTRGFGNFVEIDHGNDFTSRYLHMQKSFVKSGEKIERGKVIGLVGNSGRSTGSHLHYEIKYKGKYINPAKFMRVGKYSLANN